MPEEKTIVSLATATAQEVIAELGMQPHPEGGHFVEIFRDRPSTGERGAVTSIYFLLKSGEICAGTGSMRSRSGTGMPARR